MSGSGSRKITPENTATTADGHEGERSKLHLADLRNGKVHFKQKCITFEKQSETLQEIVQFREMLEERIKQQEPPLSYISEEHLPLIVKLAHESDKSLVALSKQIRQELLPTQDEDDDLAGGTSVTLAMLPTAVVETAIKAVMERNNYGLDGVAGSKPPAAVCVWRWEVKEQHRRWLPKNVQEKAENRIAERIQAKQDLVKTFESLPQDQRDAILDPKGNGKLSRKEANVAQASIVSDAPPNESSPQIPPKSKKRVKEENDLSSTKAMRTLKQADAIKIIKEQDKMDKKAAKEQKDKKEKEAHEKSRSIMANFFAKPKNTPSKSPLNAVYPGDIADSSSIQSDFEKSFKPFALKKDAQLAPVNWFLESNQHKNRLLSSHIDRDIIVIDDVEGDREASVNMDARPLSTDNVVNFSTTDHLRSIVYHFPEPADPSRRHPSSKYPTQFKTYNAMSVRDIFSQLSEAEVVGDDMVVRTLLSKLDDRSMLPAKAFIFHEDARPGYYGTWTRSSRIIGPRTPFAKDVIVFDYGYDSGEEWEAEPTSDVEDIVDDGEEEDDKEDAESDLDSWLVDDDEDNGSGGPVEEPDQPAFIIPSFPSKRKAEDGETKQGKRRKVVVPLVPFARGACWETAIGRCEHRLFDPYRIHIFNDTPFPINPFTFVSHCIEDSKQKSSAGSSNKSALTDNDNETFVVPSLPSRSNKATTTNPAPLGVSSSPTSQLPNGAKKAASTPKTAFPDVHLPFLLEKISNLQSGSMNFLVETIYRELREHNVKKNMIESKVREVSEKCQEKRLWVVKSGIQIPP